MESMTSSSSASLPGYRKLAQVRKPEPSHTAFVPDRDRVSDTAPCYPEAKALRLLREDASLEYLQAQLSGPCFDAPFLGVPRA